ncbi:hypothetical protein [Listeria kieliensis]|uniref:Uncharacterized protein n=1 Tax=Listeria kieliensis TaxID=1621700 RepID=A0A3D8TSW1_9LIST|nr:hypothetical protein [Listeria kieliensis]RDX02051.1 hypothetical protein UR08_00445 [Listeria kieliensis]
MNLQTALKLFFTGLFLLFVLQLISYLNWLLIDQGVMDGVLDKYLLLKTPLIIIPLLFFIPILLKILNYYFPNDN